MTDTCRHHEFNIKRPVSEGRPESAPEIPDYCIGCGAEITLKPSWVRCMNDGCEGKWWILEGSEELPSHQYRCEACNDKMVENVRRSRELEADCPPKWFDPADAGEEW